jgi:hypothetical protein
VKWPLLPPHPIVFDLYLHSLPSRPEPPPRVLNQTTAQHQLAYSLRFNHLQALHFSLPVSLSSLSALSLPSPRYLIILFNHAYHFSITPYVKKLLHLLIITILNFPFPSLVLQTHCCCNSILSTLPHRLPAADALTGFSGITYSPG